MAADHAERLAEAMTAAVAGDVDRLEGLFASDIEWRGVTTGRLWWRRTPACHGAGEVGARIRQWLRSVDASGGRVDAGVVAVGADRVIVEMRWFEEASDSPHTWYEVVSFHGGRIVDMLDCVSREDAFGAAGLLRSVR